jgi:hypothetical protein
MTFSIEQDQEVPNRVRISTEVRAFLALSVAGVLFGGGLRWIEAKAFASDPCTDSYMGLAVRGDVRRLEGDGSIEQQQTFWSLQAILSISFPETLRIQDNSNDANSFTLDLEPESGP